MSEVDVSVWEGWEREGSREGRGVFGRGWSGRERVVLEVQLRSIKCLRSILVV